MVKLEGICPPTLSLKPFGSFSTYMDLLSMHYHEGTVHDDLLPSLLPLVTLYVLMYSERKEYN